MCTCHSTDILIVRHQNQQHFYKPEGPVLWRPQCSAKRLVGSKVLYRLRWHSGDLLLNTVNLIGQVPTFTGFQSALGYALQAL